VLVVFLFKFAEQSQIFMPILLSFENLFSFGSCTDLGEKSQVKFVFITCISCFMFYKREADPCYRQTTLYAKPIFHYPESAGKITSQTLNLSLDIQRISLFPKWLHNLPLSASFLKRKIQTCI
jgi:hypothetical protein